MQLHTLIHGEDSDPLVGFCHGLFGQGKNWTGIAKSLARDDAPFQSLLIDLPNHGRSPWTDSIDLEAWADAVAETLTAALAGRQRTHLVGHSLGGKVAMLVALRHPELVASLVVVDMSPVEYALKRSFGQYIEGMQKLDLTALPDRNSADAQLQDAVPDQTIRSFLMQNLRRTDDPAQPWRWMMNLALIDEQFERLGAWPAQDTTYDGPVLWVGGEHSDYITPDHTDAMTRLFPRVRSVTVKNAGHWVHSEQPEVFTALLEAFLSRHR